MNTRRRNNWKSSRRIQIGMKEKSEEFKKAGSEIYL